MLYDVSVSRISTATRDFRVEAASADEAEAKALEQAGDEDYTGCVVDYDFDVNGVLPVDDAPAGNSELDDGDDDSESDDEPEASEDLECFLCGATQKSVRDAIEANWTPSFLIGERQEGPVCSQCYEKYLMADESGEDVLKPEYAEGQYVSEWESGETYTSFCVVNVPTREVEVFESYEKGDDDLLVEEYVTIGGTKYKVAHADDRGNYTAEEQARIFFWT